MVEPGLPSQVRVPVTPSGTPRALSLGKATWTAGDGEASSEW